MKRDVLSPLSVCMALVLPACAPNDSTGDEGDETGTTASDDDGSDDDGTGDDGDTGGGGTSGDDATSSDGSSGSTDESGTTDPGGENECDMWEQDCPDGEKCMWWSDGGPPYWTRCVPVDPNPGQPGDACTIEGDAYSGIDDCDAGSGCMPSEAGGLEGICIAFCTGTPDNPVCEDPSTTCLITGDGVGIICLPLCDPLLQDCAGVWACYLPMDQFVCLPDFSGADSGSYGDPCEQINGCHPGLTCVDAYLSPGCQGAIGCCTPFCDATEPNACPGMAEGEECVPVWPPGEGPPEYEHVGVCQLP